MWTIFALAIVASGCRTPPPIRTVRIETDPPGARVYFGIAGTPERAREQRQYVGASPCVLTVPCDEDGRFVNTVSSFARPVAVFYADPPSGTTNLHAKSQTFAVPAAFVRPPPIPSAVFLDLTKP